MPRGIVGSKDSLTLFNTLPAGHSPTGLPGFLPATDSLENIHHSCAYCRRFFAIDLTKDPVFGNVLSKPQSDAILRVLNHAEWASFLDSVAEGERRGELRELLKRTCFFDVDNWDLFDGVSRGCLFCDHLLENLKPEQRLGRNRSWRNGAFIVGVTIDEPPGQQLSFCAFMRHSFKLSEWSSEWQAMEIATFYPFAPIARLGNENMYSILPRIINPSPFSARSQSWLRSCLVTCLERHDECPKPGTFVPTRLLSLSGSLEDLNIRLVTTSPQDRNSEYVALSYCWGGPQPLQLTTSTFKVFRDYIRVERLPPTLLDAIKVTLSLGIQYIWIDVLCIIQDSYTDKLNEIAQMPSIYSHATVTVVASRAASVSHGFLGDRADGQIPGFHLGFEGVPNQPHDVLLFPEEHTTKFDYAAKGDGEYDEPLSFRAWAFQERILSARVLDFRTFQTVWSCQHQEVDAVQKQMWVDGLETPTMYSAMGLAQGLSRILAPWLLDTDEGPDRPVNHVSEELEELNLSDSSSIRNTLDLDDPEIQWEWLVKGYSKRLITFPQDRLPAISAVARVFQARHKTEVTAGLLMSELPLALLWHRVSVFSGKIWPRPDGYLGPTWSWVSVVGEVRLFRQVSEFRMGATTRRLGRVLGWKSTDDDAQHAAEDNFFSLTYLGRLKPVYWRSPRSEELEPQHRTPRRWRPLSVYRESSPSAASFQSARAHRAIDSDEGRDYDEVVSRELPRPRSLPDLGKTSSSLDKKTSEGSDLYPQGGKALPSDHLFRQNERGEEELLTGDAEFDVHVPEFETHSGSDVRLQLFFLPIATGYVKEAVPVDRPRDYDDDPSGQEEFHTEIIVADAGYERQKIRGYNEPPPHPTMGLLLQGLENGSFKRLGVFKHLFDTSPVKGRSDDPSEVPRLAGMSDDEVIEIYTSQHKWLMEGAMQEFRLV